jgi:hypothetical protein
MGPPDRKQPLAAHRYQVFGVSAEGDQHEQLLKSFDHGFEAAAFAKLVSAGGRYHRVRVDSPVNSGEQDSPRRSLSDEQDLLRSRPGCLYKLLYVGSLLGGGLLSLALGFLCTVGVMAWFINATGWAPAGGVLLATFLAIASGLTALVVKVHAALFRERGER